MNLLYRVLGLVLVSGNALAQAWNPAETMQQDGWLWTHPQQYTLPGAQVSVQHFQTSLTPALAAQRLAQSSGMRLTRLQLAGTTVFLSGGQGAEHWLAQVQPGAGGAIGLLSRLAPVAVPALGFDPVGLAPTGARRVFQVSDHLSVGTASFSSFDCPGALPQVAAVVGQALRAARWVAIQLEPNVVRLPGEWRHPDLGRLSVSLHPRTASVALTFRHHPQEPL